MGAGPHGRAANRYLRTACRNAGRAVAPPAARPGSGLARERRPNCRERAAGRPERPGRSGLPGDSPAPLPSRPPGRAHRNGGRGDRRRAHGSRSRGAALSGARRSRERRCQSVGDAVDRRIACAAPTAARGIGSRPTSRSRSISSRRPTRSTTRSTRALPPTSRANSATSTCRSSCMPSWLPRRASST